MAAQLQLQDCARVAVEAATSTRMICGQCQKFGLFWHVQYQAQCPPFHEQCGKTSTAAPDHSLPVKVSACPTGVSTVPACRRSKHTWSRTVYKAGSESESFEVTANFSSAWSCTVSLHHHSRCAGVKYRKHTCTTSVEIANVKSMRAYIKCTYNHAIIKHGFKPRPAFYAADQQISASSANCVGLSCALVKYLWVRCAVLRRASLRQSKRTEADSEISSRCGGAWRAHIVNNCSMPL